MLSDMIDILWSAKISGNEKEIEKAYGYLASVGVDRTTADIMLKEHRPERES